MALSILIAGGVYAYEYVLRSNIDDLRASLEHNQSTLSAKDITEWQRLDNRIDTLKGILNNHLAFSEFFGILGIHTLTRVRFNRFSYELDNEGVPHITLNGEAPDYAAVVAQSDVFGRVESFQEPVFSELSLDASGNVSFTVKMKVDRDLVSYTKIMYR